MKNKIRILSCLVLMISALFTNGQTFNPNTEIGGSFGLSYYIGDLNTNHFSSPKPAAAIMVRRNLDRRFSLKAQIKLSNIEGDDRNSSDSISLDLSLIHI